MIGMSPVAIAALMGLLGSGAAAAFITEWLKQRDNRASAASDLDIWTKLPEGEAKSRLLTSIERRVWLLIEPPKPSLSSFAFLVGVLWVIVKEVISNIGGDAKWEHHPDGMLWRRTYFGPTARYETFIDWLAIAFLEAALFYGLALAALWAARHFGRFGDFFAYYKATKGQAAEEETPAADTHSEVD
jgi:hypothetical protein